MYANKCSIYVSQWRRNTVGTGIVIHSLGWSIDCALGIWPSFADHFTSTPEYKKYCTCSPKCQRNIFDISVSMAAFSEFAMYGMILDDETIPHLAELGRVRDWTFLHTRNRTYIQQIYQIETSLLYNMNHDDWVDPVILSDYKDTMLYVYSHVQGLNTSNTDFVDCFIFTISGLINQSNALHMHFENSWFIKFIYEDSVAEDFKVRLAHDILRKLGKTKPFLEYRLAAFTNILDGFNQLSMCFDLVNRTSVWHPYINSTLTKYITYGIINTTLARINMLQALSIYKELQDTVDADYALRHIEPWKAEIRNKEFIK